MTPKNIGAVYFYLVSLISLFVIVGGIFSSVHTGLKIMIYEKYPSRFGPPIGMCRTVPPIPAMEKLPAYVSTPSGQEMENWKKECEENALIEGKRQKIDDITRSVVMLLVGGALFAYHFPKARKSSN